VNIVERRSNLSGHDRVHVETTTGTHLGYIDLETGGVVTEQMGFEHVMAECGTRWLRSGSPAELAAEQILAAELVQIGFDEPPRNSHR
jgi:hypothetical protein